MKNPIAPLIDIVFLLLIYFMVTAMITTKEGDIGFTLPTPGPITIVDPIEAYIQIEGDGSVIIEGMHFKSTDRELQELVNQMATLKKLADAQHSDFYVTLAPEGDAMHGRVIDVLDACREAKVRHLMFAQKET